MPIIKIRRQCTDSSGKPMTIVTTNLFLETINVVHDYIYYPIKNYVNKKTDNYDIAKLAKNIIQTQTDEIRIMSELIAK